MKIQYQNQSITLDAKQITVKRHLNHLAKHFTKRSKKNQSRLAIKSWFTNSDPVKSLYIFGKVGRGKSMLMQGFFKDLGIKNKVYFHFNNLMQEIHKELHKLRKIPANKKRDLVFDATAKVIGSAKVLCFDEMQVEDVADAMILQGMFKYFAKNDIAVVTTSNCHPLELYENGLQRNLFLKFVDEILLANFMVLNLDGQVDYRGKKETIKKHYFCPNNLENKKEVLGIWKNLIGDNKPKSKEIELLGRKIVAKKTFQDMAMFDFSELCLADLGTADFGAITKTFSQIFLLNIPILTPEDRGAAKRLIWFVDEAYENNVELVVLADSKPDEIYTHGIGHKAFKRTASRLSQIF